MRILRAIVELPSVILDAYVEWYRRRYVPERGDLVTNTRDLHISSMGWIAPGRCSSGDALGPYVTVYSTPTSKLILRGTPMVCIDSQESAGYIFRFNETDVVLPERLIVYFRVVSRRRDAHG